MSSWLKVAVVFAVAAPSVALRLAGVHPGPSAAVAIHGSAVVASAFLLVWAAGAAQRDMSGSLATVILAVIAVLPEYAIDLYFGWSAGHEPQNAHYAAANMTGSNRLLVGLGWSFVAILFAMGRWRRKQPVRGVRLVADRRVDLGFLALASLYSVVIPLTRRLAWYDAVVLLTLFFAYLRRAAEGARDEPELIGVARAIGDLPRSRRRVVFIALFLGAAFVILLASEPFALGLVAGGKQLGVDEFLLVQWLAPLASESPELIVAGVLAWRGHEDAALGTLLSSKVSQWTLLLGCLPIAYLVGGGGGGGLALDARQTEEFVLTAAQTLLGLSVLIDLDFVLWEAVLVVALFALQLVLPGTRVRLALAVVYALVAVVLLVRDRREVPRILRRALTRDPKERDGARALS